MILHNKTAHFASRQFLTLWSDTFPRSCNIRWLRHREQKSDKILENQIAFKVDEGIDLKLF